MESGYGYQVSKKKISQLPIKCGHNNNLNRVEMGYLGRLMDHYEFNQKKSEFQDLRVIENVSIGVCEDMSEEKNFA